MRRSGTVSIRFDADAVAKKLRDRQRLADANRIWGAIQFATKVALQATPVWTGDTRANYRWSVGAKGVEYIPYNQHRSWRNKNWFPLKSSAGPDALSLAALEAFRSVVYSNPYQRFVLYNNVSYENGMTILDLEYGSLTGTPHLMMAKAKQALALRLSVGMSVR